MRRSLAALLAVLALCSPVRASQPADGWYGAWVDSKNLAPEQGKFTRWLWFKEKEPKLQWTNYLALVGHLNSLSVRKRIAHPVLLLDDGTTRLWPTIEPEAWGRVLCARVDCLAYWPDASTWDKLGDPALEPYFHVFTLVPYPAGRYTDRSTYPAGEEKAVAVAPWLLEPLGMPKDGPALTDARKRYREAVFGLIERTDYSPCPVVEVTNFIWQSAIQFDRKAGYYDFLGIKDRDSAQKLAGFDPKLSKAYANPLLEAVSVSGVASQPRRVEIWQKIGGVYVFTKDQVNQRATGKRNPLQTQGLNDLVHDAEEAFFTLPNNWWGLLLCSDKGVRQDSAPDGVGYLHQSLSNDGKIHIGFACFTCHDRKAGNGGMQPFQPYFRNLYFGAPVALGLFDEQTKHLKKEDRVKAQQDLVDQYLTPIDLDPYRRAYVQAVYEATGLTPDKWAAYQYEVFHRYDSPVDFDRAAVEFGVTTQELFNVLGVQMRFYGKLDNVTANWLSPAQRRSKIGRDQFAEVYNQGQLALRGLPTWPDSLRHKYPARLK